MRRYSYHFICLSFITNYLLSSVMRKIQPTWGRREKNEGKKRVRKKIVMMFSWEIGKWLRCVMHLMVLFIWTSSASLERIEGRGGRIGDGMRRRNDNIIKRGTEELSGSWQTLKLLKGRGDHQAVWETYNTKVRSEERNHFSFPILSPSEPDWSQEKRSCLRTLCLASAGTSTQAKPREKDWRCFCFVSWQKMISTQTQRLATINTLFFTSPPPPFLPLSWQLWRQGAGRDASDRNNPCCSPAA